MDTVVFTDSTVISYFSNGAILAKVDAEVDTVLAKKYSVSAYPTLIVAKSSGEEIDRIVGAPEAADLLKTIEDYKKGIGTLAADLELAKTDTSVALKMKVAERMKYRGRAAEAETWYGKVLASASPKDTLSGMVRMELADMYRRAKDTKRAEETYQSVVADFKGTPMALDAEYLIANSYRRNGDTTKAIMLFEQFIKNHPGTENAELAQKRVNDMKAAQTAGTPKK